MLRLEKREKHLSGQMSGGQQQRVSIGRALINEPAFIIFCIDWIYFISVPLSNKWLAKL